MAKHGLKAFDSDMHVYDMLSEVHDPKYSPSAQITRRFFSGRLFAMAPDSSHLVSDVIDRVPAWSDGTRLT